MCVQNCVLKPPQLADSLLAMLQAHLRLTRDQQLQIIECFKHYKKVSTKLFLMQPQLGSIWSKSASLLSSGCVMQATEPLVAKRTMICATLGKVSRAALWALAEQQDVLLRSGVQSCHLNSCFCTPAAFRAESPQQ